jgi:hypothetical protein
MNRNTESHFSLAPHVDISRSRFDRSASLKTSFNAGDVVPFFLDEVLPGDTFSVDTSKVVRMQTLLTPMMDNVYLDTYYFFVPNRLVWDHWKEFCGENTESAWIPATEYTMPQITSPAGTGWDVGTLADYFGIPTGVAGLSVSALPFRAYALIMNEWFRDQNLQDPLVVPTDDSTVAGVNTGTTVTDVAKGGKPFIASKYHDYFTSALPSPQKGPDVLIPAATAGEYPVVTRDAQAVSGTVPNLRWVYTNGTTPVLTNTGLGTDDSGSYTGAHSQGATDSNHPLVPANLFALASGGLGATINQLRLAFQIQKFYEQQARGGSRYTEVVRSFFGVTSPDARLQRPEYLGGNRVPINVNQIVQQSGTESSGTPQGTVVGQSLTTDKHSDFTEGFQLCGLFRAFDVEEFIVVPRRAELLAAFRRRNVDILVFNTVRIFVEILTCNSRLSGHESKLRLNIVFCIKLSFLSFQLFHNVASSISTRFPCNFTNNYIAIRPTLLERGTVIVSVIFTSFLDGLVRLNIVEV